MSSSASSWMTSTTSSTVIAPIRRPASPITGAETRSYWSKTWPTSSWSVSAGIALTSVAMMVRSRTGRRVRNSLCSGIRPIGRYCGSIT